MQMNKIDKQIPFKTTESTSNFITQCLKSCKILRSHSANEFSLRGKKPYANAIIF
jgi:hypothetical protein